MDCDTDDENNDHTIVQKAHSQPLSSNSKPTSLPAIEYVDSMQCDPEQSKKPPHLFSLLLNKRKQSQRNRRRRKSGDTPDDNAEEANANDVDRKLTQAELRVKKDLKEISDSKWCARGTEVAVHVLSRYHSFEYEISPKDGYYRGGTFCFDIMIPKHYPFQPPTIRARHPIFHPNINLHSLQIGLPIVCESEWKPVLSLNDVLFALQLIFLKPIIDEIDSVCCKSHAKNDDEDSATFRSSSSSSVSQYHRKRFAFGSNNHKPSYVPNLSSGAHAHKSAESSGIDTPDHREPSVIHNMTAALMFRDETRRFERVCQQLIAGGVHMFDIQWQCVRRQTMRLRRGAGDSETYDPSLGPQSFRVRDDSATTRTTKLVKKASVTGKRHRNELYEEEEEEDAFTTTSMERRRVRCLPARNGSVVDRGSARYEYHCHGVESTSTSPVLIHEIDNMNLCGPPEKRRRLNDHDDDNYDDGQHRQQSNANINVGTNKNCKQHSQSQSESSVAICFDFPWNHVAS